MYGDVVALGSGVAEASKVYLETGYVLAGVAKGTNLQLGGPGHGDLNLLTLRSRWTYFNTIPTDPRKSLVSINENPMEFGTTGLATDGMTGTSLYVTPWDGTAAAAIFADKAGGTGITDLVQIRGAPSGAAPTFVLGALRLSFGSDGNIRLYDSGAVGRVSIGLDTSGVDATKIRFVDTGAGQVMLILGHYTSWSDSVSTSRLNLGDTARGIVTGRTGVALDRFGISSKYTLISNDTPTGSDALAPSANPEVLQIINTTNANGDNASVLLKILGQRTGQTADLMQVVSAVAGNATFKIDSKAFLQASIKSTSFFVDSTDLTKKLALALTGITTAITRTWTVGNYSGVPAVPVDEGLSGRILTSNGAGAQPTWNVGGGGGGASATTVEVNVATTPKTGGKFTITDAAIGASSKVLVWQAPGPYTGKGTRADEAQLAPVKVSAVSPAAGSAVVYWEAEGHVATVPGYVGDFGGLDTLINAFQNNAAMFPISRLRAKRIGKVRGNIKFSYVIFA